MDLGQEKRTEALTRYRCKPVAPSRKASFAAAAFSGYPSEMAKPKAIELADGTSIPILYEDRSVLAIDKPAGWLLAPDFWDKTGRNLQLALQSSIQAGDFWARSRNLKFLRFVHRLDEDTTGVLLLVKSVGAVPAYSALFDCFDAWNRSP